MFSLIVVVAVSITTLYFLHKRKKREKSAKYAKSFLTLFENAKAKLERLAGGEYLNNAKVQKWLNSREGVYIKTFDHSLINPDLFDESLRLSYLKARQNGLSYEINKQFVRKRLEESGKLFDSLGLTESQRLAVVRDEDANLVNAGAGSGKTRTILGKIQYIFEWNLAKPAEILIVVYNKKIQEEIEEKIEKISSDIKVTTFHSLGLEIMRETESTQVVISSFADDERKMGGFFIEKIKELFKSNSTNDLLINFFTASQFEGDLEKGVKTKDEYLSRISPFELRSLDGSKLKSRQEVAIANWLILNGIEWEYERDYPHNESKKQYKPDFYLPEYNIWVEHFGIDEHGNTAPYVNKKEYNEGIEWKRNIHKQNKTRLVETYSYETKKNGGLTKSLEEKLVNYGVKKRQISNKTINQIVENRFKPIPNFIKLVVRFLSLCRENKLDKQKLEESSVSIRDRAFLLIFNILRKFYEDKLQSDDEVDFTDMIVHGMEYVKNGKYQSNYKYILVDEYQDITKVRLEFLLSLQSQVENARLFCVGDDWQSIYQFQGANVSLITGFENYVDAMQRTDLDQTFRYPQKVSDFSSTFITQNPAQLNKDIKSSIASKDEDRPIKIIYHEPMEYKKAFDKVVDYIVSQSGQKTHKCFVLGRYNYNKPVRWREITQYAKSNEVDMEFSTIHKSKGRESDWVVILENKSDPDGLGFPSEVQDDPVLRMILPDNDSYPNAEERRLFYVAVTRTRQGVFLLVPTGKASKFIKEIEPRADTRGKMEESKGVYEPFVDVEKNAVSMILFCPECKGQTIQKKPTNDGKYFYGCSHWPLCNGVLPICTNEGCDAAVDLNELDSNKSYICFCGLKYKICPQCGKGVLERKTGSYGEFLGCSQYNSVAKCSYTESLPTH